MTELPFKAAFLAAFVCAVTIAARTAKISARLHGSSINQLANEVRMLIAIRAALGVVFYASLFAWLFMREPPPFMRVALAPAWRWTGVGLPVPLLAFYGWAFQSIGTNYRGGIGLHDRHQLIESGAYRWMRHPIYAAFVAIMIDLLLVSANWPLALSGLALVASIAAVRVPIEERELADRFGAAWSAYAARTRRWWPLLR